MPPRIFKHDEYLATLTMARAETGDDKNAHDDSISDSKNRHNNKNHLELLYCFHTLLFWH